MLLLLQVPSSLLRCLARALLDSTFLCTCFLSPSKAGSSQSPGLYRIRFWVLRPGRWAACFINKVLLERLPQSLTCYLKPLLVTVASTGKVPGLCSKVASGPDAEEELCQCWMTEGRNEGES